MITFLKANVASIIASLCDFLITKLAVDGLHLDVVIGSVVGTTCGGIINFLIGRHWAFSAKQGKVHTQAFRYALVWAGNLGLNAGGMYVLAKLAGIYYMAAKVIVSLLVAIAYNYPMQKLFVFKNNKKEL